MSQWYLLRDGQSYGPYAEGKVREWIKTGQMRPEEKLAREGEGRWLEQAKIPEFEADFWVAPTSPLPAAPPPSQTAAPVAPPQSYYPPSPAQPAQAYYPPPAGGQFVVVPQPVVLPPQFYAPSSTAPPAVASVPPRLEDAWSGWAIAGMICGTVGQLFCPFLGGVLGIIFSNSAIKQGDARHGKPALWVSIAVTVFLAIMFAVGIGKGGRD